MRLLNAVTRHRRPLIWGVSLAALVATGAQAQAPAAEESVEAAYLHKFPGFVEWPADEFKEPTSAIVIGIAGAPKVFDELTRLAKGRLVIGRPVEVRAIIGADLPHDLQVLFVGRGAMPLAHDLIDAAQTGHVLSVTDLPDGLRAGAILGFVQVDGRLRFEASLGAARRTRLQLSSKLLSVASRVIEEAP